MHASLHACELFRLNGDGIYIEACVPMNVSVVGLIGGSVRPSLELRNMNTCVPSQLAIHGD